MNPEVGPILEAIGFNVTFAVAEPEIDFHDDIDIVRWSRKHHRIVLTHDRFKDSHTKIRMRIEVRQHGGRIIGIYGGSEDPYAAVGRLLTYRPRWRETFVVEKRHGIIRVGEQNYVYKDRHELVVPQRALDRDLVEDASRRLREYEPPIATKTRTPPVRASARLIRDSAEPRDG